MCSEMEYQPSGRNLQRLGSLTALFQSMMPILFFPSRLPPKTLLSKTGPVHKMAFLFGCKTSTAQKTGERDVKGKGRGGWRGVEKYREVQIESRVDGEKITQRCK